MRNVFMSLIFLHVLKAALIGDTTKHQACYLDISVGWHELCDRGQGSGSCSYHAPVGWAIKNYKPIITTNNNGKYEVTKNTSSKSNKLVSEDLSNSIFQTLLASGKLDFEQITSVATLMGEYIALRETVPENGTLSFDGKAQVQAPGDCQDRKRGWIMGYVEVEEVYLGQNYQDIVDWIVIKNKQLGPLLDKFKCDDNGCVMN